MDKGEWKAVIPVATDALRDSESTMLSEARKRADEAHRLGEASHYKYLRYEIQTTGDVIDTQGRVLLSCERDGLTMFHFYYGP